MQLRRALPDCIICKGLNRSPLKVNDLLFLSLSPNGDTWMLYDSAFSKRWQSFSKGISINDLWAPRWAVWCVQGRRESQHCWKSCSQHQQLNWELNMHNLCCFVFQPRRGATCTVNPRRQGTWCTWRGWCTTGPAAPTRMLTASVWGGTAWWGPGGSCRAQQGENKSNSTLSFSPSVTKYNNTLGNEEISLGLLSQYYVWYSQLPCMWLDSKSTYLHKKHFMQYFKMSYYN